MRRMKASVPTNTLETVYKALVQPYFDYRSPLWDNCSKRLKDKLQRVRTRAARVLIGASYNVRSADVLDTLSWDMLDTRRSCATSVLMYKILNDHTAPGFRNSFFQKKCYSRHLQSSY